jgi:cyclic beta-1,2-glucan synthetase
MSAEAMTFSSIPPILRGVAMRLVSLGLGLAAIMTARKGGSVAGLAGLLGALALLGWGVAMRGRLGRVRDFVLDFIAIALFAAVCDPGGVLWRAPGGWADIFRMSAAGATFAAGLYLVVSAVSLSTQRAHPGWRASLALIALPFVFNMLLGLGSGPADQLGRWSLIGQALQPDMQRALGRALMLVVINEAVVAGVVVAMGRRMPRALGLHLVLIAAAFFAALTPNIAEMGSTRLLANAPLIWQLPAVIATAALAQAGLWAEVYLVTALAADMLWGRPPTAANVRGVWTTGAAKGLVYGGAFMAILHGMGLVVGWGRTPALMQALGVVVPALAGALVYPLARTVLESTDTTPPFLRRFLAQLREPANYIRGAVVGAGVAWLVNRNFGGMGDFDRFIAGCVLGAVAYAGVDLAMDALAILRGPRQKLESWRIYALGAFLGAILGGAIGWYLDAGQIATVTKKFFDYITVSNAAAGKPTAPYIINPLFSKWGATDLGLLTGGVKLLYDESLSGVIQWVFAAPLFSFNLFFLTALLQRSTAPLKRMVSPEGVASLVDNAIQVLRWGLWMAPIIYSFLKAAGDPAWYNQDGMVRSGVATAMSLSLSPDAFRAWSLEIFTGLLAYDWLRVLIWFDHMGLRVATLVNLSFVGGDMADEKAAKFLGAATRTRVVPEAIRRFGTWAPLLLPFYIPRGAEWDKAWTGAERMAQSTSPVTGLLLGYAAVAGVICVALGVEALLRLTRRDKLRATTAASETEAPQPRQMTLTNGLVTLELSSDGQGYSRVEGPTRDGPPIDITRRPDDPLVPRGKFLYLREIREGAPGHLWSLGSKPTDFGDVHCRLTRLSPTSARLTNSFGDIHLDADIALMNEGPGEVWRVRLINTKMQPRKLSLATYREWVMNEAGVERRDPAYNAIHVGTTFVRSLGAIFARNRLLKTRADKAAERKLSHEIAYHAVRETPGVRLVGYEDSKPQFFGLGTPRAPQSLFDGAPPRPVEDEGLLYTFDPGASLRLEVDVPASGEVELMIVDGWARNAREASQTIAAHFGVEPPRREAIQAIMTRMRKPTPARPSGKPRFEFSADGSELLTRPGSPRPYAHVIANELGHGAVLTNDGDIYTFHHNARANSVTPFRMGEGRWLPPGQGVYIADLAANETTSATFTPCRRADGRYDVRFGRGYAVYRNRRGDLDIEMTVFAAVDAPVLVKIVKVRNTGASTRVLRVVPFAEITLAETPAESVGRVVAETSDNARELFFRNPSNDIVSGWAFVTTSLAAEFAETSRRRFLGGADREPCWPYMVEHGHPDSSAEDDGWRIAGFAGNITVPQGGEETIVFSIGQTGTREDAALLARQARDLGWAERSLRAVRDYWTATLGVVRIETNRPDFDRLVNDWLPYQLLTSRLWGRTGQAQRSGAIGYRDQLQDVLPLIMLKPEAARRQILLHARQQFIEGDVLKWWHRSEDGRTGLGDRSRASDPHLWLPYLTVRYVAQTGDAGILDEVSPFIEGVRVPAGEEGRMMTPLPSRDAATLVGHCQRAIDHTLARRGRRGLPLMGVGDWDDGMNLVGWEGRGESVWMGFFLHDTLTRFAALLDGRRDERAAARYLGAARDLAAALAGAWEGDRFVRAWNDDGKVIKPMSAMTSAWPALSGAIPHERSREAAENALAALDKGDRVLLVTPPYTEHSDPIPGRSADYPPGVRENGGQYSHGVSWFVDALALLARQAADEGRADDAAHLRKRASEVWMAISPLTKYAPEMIDVYGLPPHQQPADVYDGPGYEGRGGWAWYTGAAARMIAAAHAMLGVRMVDGAFTLEPDAFEPRGDLQLRSVTYKGKRHEKTQEPQAAEAV